MSLLIPLLEQSGQVPRGGCARAAHAAAPGNLNLTPMLTRLYASAGDQAKALAVFNTDALLDDKTRSLLRSRAAAEVAARQLAAARNTYESLIASVQPYFRERFAAFLISQNAMDEAGQQSTVASAPGNPELQRALMHQRYRASGFDAALSAAESLRRDPANMPGASLLTDDVLVDAGKQTEAAAAYQAELAQAPSSTLATHAAAAANVAHGPIQAIQLLRSWLKSHPDDLPAMAMLSSLLTEAKQHDATARVLETLLARRPNDTRVMNNLAVAYRELGDARAYPLALRAYLSTVSPLQLIPLAAS